MSYWSQPWLSGRSGAKFDLGKKGQVTGPGKQSASRFGIRAIGGQWGILSKVVGDCNSVLGRFVWLQCARWSGGGGEAGSNILAFVY